MTPNAISGLSLNSGRTAAAINRIDGGLGITQKNSGETLKSIHNRDALSTGVASQIARSCCQRRQRNTYEGGLWETRDTGFPICANVHHQHRTRVAGCARLSLAVAEQEDLSRQLITIERAEHRMNACRGKP